MKDKKREQLAKPFREEDIEWRIQQSGKSGDKVWAMCLAYVTNRAIMERLDDVFGVFGWQNEFMPTPHNDGVMCGISVKHDGEWITKYDGAQNTDIEAVKGGISSAMKRTAVQFGIGRYLYNLEAGFVQVVEKGTAGAKYAKGKDFTFYWLPPVLPNWALPIEPAQIKLIDDLVVKKGANKEDMLDYFGLSSEYEATKAQGVTMIELLSKKKDKDEK